MRLTSLEIKGFKSFGDKVTIHFDKGVTAIVGPNGSGKSNVVDAMRWVLGEQKTRMLRSEKMENIIFNGTRNRKPANLAEVSLSFENTRNILPTEYSTITITRKLYRTGESEYNLNGVPCRLKDITDLFLDTGIGSDSYSIIELKMIDEIINDKNNTLIGLFEEAAGISKYKVRKKQTLQKLEETDNDLSRVNDLLFEIEKNLKSLEAQAKKTERYYKIRDQYKELSTELASFTIAGYQSTFEKLQQQENQVNDEKIHTETRIDTEEAELQKIKLEHTDEEKHLLASQKLLNEKINTIRQVENEKKIKNERLKFLRDKEESLTLKLQQDKKYLSDLLDSLQKLNAEHLEQADLLKKNETELQSQKVKLDDIRLHHADLQKKVQEKTQSLTRQNEKVFEAEKLLVVQKTQQEALVTERVRLETEISKRQEERTKLESQKEQILILKEQKETEGEQHQESFENIENKGLEIAKKLYALQEELQKLNRLLDSRQNEYNLTKSLVESLEGYPESLKFLKKKAKGFEKTPLLSDVIGCPPEYKIAVESLLEPYLNYFICDTKEEALQGITLLQKEKQGRVNFFILSEVEPVKAITAKTEARPVIEVLDVEKKYKDLISNLLEKVYLAEEVPKETGENTYLLRSGELVKGPYFIAGGSVGLFEGKRIGRGKNLENLEKEIEEGKKGRSEIQEKLESAKEEEKNIRQEKEKLTQVRQVAQNEYHRLNTQIATLEAQARQIQSVQDQEQKRLEKINSDLQLLSTPEKQVDEKDLQDYIAARIETEKELNVLKEELQQVSEQLNQYSGTFNQHNITFLQQQNRVNTIIRDLSFKNSQAEEIRKGIDLNETELTKAKEQISQVVDAEDSDDTLIALYEEKESLEIAVKGLEESYFKAKGLMDEKEGLIRELRKKKDQGDQILQGLKDKVNELKIQLNSLKERLSVEFGVELESLLEKKPSPEYEEKDLREKVDRLKGQIANYGPINPMAIEAYNEINERFVFINKQKGDLLEAKESLLKTIEEIDRTAREKFMEAYIQIRSNFITVFRSLFSEEDNCDLILSNPDNPLESEINIIAQPKGKRPLSINQLSGGEKTLTATALLFSIYLLKPAPFCIFDEVDAPLDDTNIDKFNKIIKKFSEDSQFIIITHNKRTMASTDIIYGVTMIELGVTQVVPVDIREVA